MRINNTTIDCFKVTFRKDALKVGGLAEQCRANPLFKSHFRLQVLIFSYDHLIKFIKIKIFNGRISDLLGSNRSYYSGIAVIIFIAKPGEVDILKLIGM